MSTDSERIEPKDDAPKNVKEQFYERFRGAVSLRTLDIAITILVAALIAVVALGIARGG